MTAIVAAVDLRPLFGPVRDQRQRPTCLAFAASDAHAAIRATWDALSPEFAFFHAQRRAGRGPAEGALLPSMLEALRLDGQPVEAGWPYLAETPNGARWIPPASVGPRFGRVGEARGPSFDFLAAELDQGRPPMILLTLSRSFYAPDDRAVVDQLPGESPDPQRRHAVVAVGHGTVDGRRAVLVRNSWGARWGDAGHAWLPERFLQPRMFAAARLTEASDVPAGPAAA